VYGWLEVGGGGAYTPYVRHENGKEVVAGGTGRCLR